MRISALRDEVTAKVQAFAWDEWAQLGVASNTDRRDRWAADPEALLLFTLEVARDEPRLFDEVLDWLVVNERIMSVQRLRNLCLDDEDRQLVAAALEWVGQWRPRARLKTSARAPTTPGNGPRALFRGLGSAHERPDEAFLRHGFLKDATEPRRHSQPPDLTAPINFSFRVRHLLGVGSRAEVMRTLLCVDAPSLTVQVIAASAGYSKRNVQEALTSLWSAGVVDHVTVASEQRYRASRDRWGALLDVVPAGFPSSPEWQPLFGALRLLVRRLSAHERDDLSDYMRASEARVLMDELEPLLRSAGIAVQRTHTAGAAYWPEFVENVRAAIATLAHGQPQ